MFNPKVSIIIPVYNGSNYMREAIESALAQTYNNFEVIVINDGSNDDGKTQEIALSYGEKIRYFEKDNGGVATALNLGIEKMTGEYFSWLSHDDVYYPNKLEVQIEYLRKTRDFDNIIFCDYQFIDSNSNIGKNLRIRNYKKERFRIYLIGGYPLNGCTLLINKNCFLDVGLFDENLKYTQDHALWFKLSKKYQFIHLPEILVKYRIHDYQDTSISAIKAANECNNLFINFLNNIAEEYNNQDYNKLGKIYLNRAFKLFFYGFDIAGKYSLELFKKYNHNRFLLFYLLLIKLFSKFGKIFRKKILSIYIFLFHNYN